MTRATRVMLLIDADNVSVDVIGQAYEHVLATHGAVHVRRAYCTPESALKHQAAFRNLSIRPIVNLSTGKNSTDIALAVDAIDLVLAERPDVVVLVSSDSDFAPLVVRLREKGCRVEGIGQAGKTGEGSMQVYDSFVDLTHRKAAAGRPAAPRAAASRSTTRTASRKTTSATPVAPEAAPAPAPAPRDPVPPAVVQPEPPPPPPAAKTTRRSTGTGTAARKTAARTGRSSRAPAPPPLPDDVQQILEAVPELRDGHWVELGIAAERLRQVKLLAKNAPSTKLFKKHPQWFALTPERQPNRVQWIGPELPR